MVAEKCPVARALSRRGRLRGANPASKAVLGRVIPEA